MSIIGNPVTLGGGTNVLTGHGAPTTSTVGAIGQHYIDLDASEEYTCLNITVEDETAVYMWSGSGGGIDIGLSIIDGKIAQTITTE